MNNLESAKEALKNKKSLPDEAQDRVDYFYKMYNEWYDQKYQAIKNSDNFWRT